MKNWPMIIYREPRVESPFSIVVCACTYNFLQQSWVLPSQRVSETLAQITCFIIFSMKALSEINEECSLDYGLFILLICWKLQNIKL